MEERRSRWGSFGAWVPVLAVGLLALAVASPSFSAGPLTKAKVKKIAKKQATKVLKKTGPGLFIEETEIDRFGQIKMSVGAADQTIGTYGPFTLRASCEDGDPDPAITSVQAEVEILTSEENSILDTYEGFEYDFDPADNSPEPQTWAGGDFLVDPGTPQESWSADTDGHASSPSGTSIDGRTAVYSNFAGTHCVFSGYVMMTAPQA